MTSLISSLEQIIHFLNPCYVCLDLTRLFFRRPQDTLPSHGIDDGRVSLQWTQTPSHPVCPHDFAKLSPPGLEYFPCVRLDKLYALHRAVLRPPYANRCKEPMLGKHSTSQRSVFPLMVQEENLADEAHKAPALEWTGHSLPSVTRHGECGRDPPISKVSVIQLLLCSRFGQQKYVGKFF